MPNAEPAEALGAQAQEDKFQSLWDAGNAAEQQSTAQPAPQQTESTPEAPQNVPRETPEPVQPETEEYADLDEYLTKSGIERDSFLTLPVTVKVDGQSKQVPLQDLFRNYQQEAHFTQKSQAFAEQQRAWEAERTQAKAKLEQDLALAQNLGNLAHQQLLGAYQGIDWNRLRMENPSEWAVRSQEFNQAAAAIQNHLAQVQQAQAQLQQQAQAERQANMPKEWEKALEAVPAWRDKAKFQADRSDMQTFGQKMGFTPEELSQIYDHRQLEALHYASQYLKLQAASPQAVKRVQAAPKQVAPGARTVKDPKQAAMQLAKERWVKNPRDADAQAAYFDTLT